MNSDFDKHLQELIHFFRTNCIKDVKIIEEAVRNGKAASMYTTLFNNVNIKGKQINEMLIHSARLFYFMGYCLDYNNGIPMLEILGDWIDNGKKGKIVNAVMSQKTLVDFLISKDVDLGYIEQYVADKELIEYAISEQKKSTGVLKRIIEQKQTTVKDEANTITIDKNETIKKSDIYEQTIRITKKATEDDVERLKDQGVKDIKLGNQISYIPEPANKEELFERFEKLHAQRYFETLQGIFTDKYGAGNKKIIEDELAALNSFIDKANQLSTNETFKNKWVDPKESELHEYSRLANKFYDNPSKKFYAFGYFNSIAVQVYARYFMYKYWLESELLKYETNMTNNNIPQPDDIEIWKSEYELRQFIDTATRWGISTVYSSRTEQNPYSIFNHKVEHARDNFEKFRTQLNHKLSALPQYLWKATEIDLNDKFIVGMNRYIKWHNDNKTELEKFQPYCPYSLMLSIIESTKKEILKYFPELNLSLEESENQILKSPSKGKKYTYSNLIDILNGMYNEQHILEQNTIEWAKLQKEVTQSIIDKLYNLQNDSQRLGFLNTTFRSFFDEGKDRNLELADSKGISGFETELDYQYVKDCKLILNYVIRFVSEACLQYEGLDFSKIMDENIRTIRDKPKFSWIVRPIELSQQPETKSNKHKNSLSVPDWSIVFYYLDEVGTKAGAKIDRIIKFIAENKVKNSNGDTTTKGSFKKEYHKIENRINQKNDKKPLPPERIKKILPYLKNNKEALQTANNDIDYLTTEMD